ncbi:MAG TPA: restriction endonuclease subunit S, partial [Flavobacteriales bacterium]|nr:restriction endonuclease subunit S [Flavobacteriales bacterium]
MNWPIKRLDELMSIERGGSPRPIQQYITDKPNGLNWIKIGDATLSGKYIYETKEKIRPEGLKKSRFVEKGDFLLSNSMSFGRPYIMGTSGCIHDGWLVLKDTSGLLDKDYLYYALSSPVVFEQFDQLAAGSTVRNLNTRLVAGVTIPVPSKTEQQRIVKKLDAAFAALSEAQALVERNRANARELFESYLNGVFEGKEGWEAKTLGELGKI